MLTKELEYAQAIEQFLEVIKYVPNNSDTLYNLALCYELVGDIERAIKYYKLAIDNDNNHKEANHNLELILGEKYIPPAQIAPQEAPQESEPKTTESDAGIAAMSTMTDEELAHDADIFGPDAM